MIGGSNHTEEFPLIKLAKKLKVLKSLAEEIGFTERFH